MQTRSNALMIVLAALLVAGFVIAVTAQPVTATEKKVDINLDLAPYQSLDLAESWHERKPATCQLVSIEETNVPMPVSYAQTDAEPMKSGRGSLLMSRVNCQ